MKKLISLSVLLFVACLAVFCQLTPADSAIGGIVSKSTGLPLGLILWVLGFVLAGIGHFVIPKKYASIFAIAEEILALINKSNNTGKKDVVPEPPITK